MKTQKIKFISAGLCGALALSVLTGCGNDNRSRNLMNDIPRQHSLRSDTDSEADAGNTGTDDTGTETADEAQVPEMAASAPSASAFPPADAVTCTDFAVRLFQACIASDRLREQAQKPPYSEASEESGNTLVSPLSVLNALAMTAGGTRGETLAQMEALFGADINSLCSFLRSYNDQLPSDRKYRLYPANSIWVKDTPDLTVSPDFLQTNADRFKADIYTAPFDDSTIKEINKWVSDNTDKMIPEILDQIPVDAVMYLVNALAFDAEWETIYEDSRVWDGIFTCENGTARDVKMMYSDEYAYLRDTNAQGFLKYYHDGKYAFAALLPEEGLSLDDYIASLTGERLHELLTNPEQTAVLAAVPKFETNYGALLNPALQSLGMTNAFDPDAADLSGLGNSTAGSLYISRVLHRTHIAVDEKGTLAGAATAVEVRAKGAMPQDLKTVCLDRPFLYMIIDCRESLPVFIGTVHDPTR